MKLIESMLSLTHLEVNLFKQTLTELVLIIAQATPSATSVAQDPLINNGEQDVIYIGVFLLFIRISIILGILYRRVDLAILFSLSLSAVLMIFILFF